MRSCGLIDKPLDVIESALLAVDACTLLLFPRYEEHEPLPVGQRPVEERHT